MANLSLDRMEDSQLLTLAEQLKSQWADRDDAIASAIELRRQKWTVPVPEGWKQTAKTQHTALAKEIPARVVGTMGLREPQFSRTPMDNDEGVQTRANTVERWHQAKWQYDKRTAMPGKNAYLFALDNLANKGALCMGSLFAPHSYWGVPAFSEEGKPLKAWWRDEGGRETDTEDALDWAATARAYIKQVDLYRRRARPPLVRRIVATEQAYPLFLDGQMLALFIQRMASPLEISSGGFVVDEQSVGQNVLTATQTFLEVWTPNRARFYANRQPLKHRVWGTDGLVHGYGFVPFTYRVGLEGGETDYGSYGTPLLSLIDSNIRMIDTMLTYQFNAIHLASFPSFYLEYVVREGTVNAAVVEAQTGKRVTSYQFKSGTIMDFGPDRKVVPFLHPGLNPDFYKFLQWQIEEVQRIIPRTLQGVAESSGYNTLQATVQAKAIFNPMADAQEIVEVETAIMDEQHLVKRVGGPIYMNLELPNGHSAQPRKVERIKVDPRDVENYYDVSVSIDRELDRITLSQAAALLADRGYLDDEEVMTAWGVTDPSDMRMRITRMGLFKTPLIQEAMLERAVKRFGMAETVKEAMASGKIQVGSDGMPMVQMPDGSLFGPGMQSTSTQINTGQPSAALMQGPAGAAMGGMNAEAAPGLPNLNSSANPTIGLPAPTPTGRSRNRRRGGAIPGAPQRQNAARPEPKPVGA